MEPNSAMSTEKIVEAIPTSSQDVQEIMKVLYTYLTEYGLKIIGAIVIFVIGKWIVKWISALIRKMMTRAKIDVMLVNFVYNITYALLLVFVIIAALSALGIQTAQFIAIIGAAGLAVGLALQGSLSNFAAGVLLILFKPIKVGDFVEVAGKIGTVKEVHIFNTILNSPENIRIIVPNSKIYGDIIKNYTVNGLRRVDLVVGISYGDDIKKAKGIIEAVMNDDEKVLKDPAPTVAVLELADSSVNLAVRPWIKPTDYWDVYFGITEKVKLALDENGITIPFPQTDVHLFKENE